jgi:hypothetical protein
VRRKERIAQRGVVKVATFNINNINKRLDNLLSWLKKERPDVVSLQEVKAEQRAFPIEAIRSLGYEAVWEGERSWNGVAKVAIEIAHRQVVAGVLARNRLLQENVPFPLLRNTYSVFGRLVSFPGLNTSKSRSAAAPALKCPLVSALMSPPFGDFSVVCRVR